MTVSCHYTSLLDISVLKCYIDKRNGNNMRQRKYF